MVSVVSVYVFQRVSLVARVRISVARASTHRSLCTHRLGPPSSRFVLRSCTIFVLRQWACGAARLSKKRDARSGAHNRTRPHVPVRKSEK